MRDDAASAIKLSDYRPPDFAIDNIELTFALAPASTRVRAVSTVRRCGAHDRALALDGVNLDLRGIAINGAPLARDAYTIQPERLIIHAPPAAFTLEVETCINPEANTALEGLYLSGGRFCTQCEAEGFRKITYFLDRPDNLARFQVRIEADKAFPILLSNGDPVEAGDLTPTRHFAVWRDPHPKPSYLFALAAGAYDVLRDDFITASGRKVALAIHVDAGQAGRAAYAMDSLKRAMRWDEEKFGREYDLDVFNIVAVRDFNFGAMENKGLNIFNSAYVLADPDAATDADYEAIESIVAHEYFHNWTGNRITCRDWFQLALKEGLTVFRDQEFSADMRSRPVQRIKDVKRLRARQFVEDAGPLAHPVRPQSYVKIDNFYTATVYEKGAEIVRMLKAYVGDDAFAQGMALYFARCDGSAATVEDFLSCFAQSAGADLSAFMEWYAQAGTPELSCETTYDAQARRATVRLSQTTPATPGQPEKAPMVLPLRLGLVGAEDGAPLWVRLQGQNAPASAEHRVSMAAARLELVFEDVAQAPIVAPLRDFCAPVRLAQRLSPDERLTQMAHDPDPFTRWEAGQEIARAAMLGAEVGSLGRFADALRRELTRAQADAAFAALALRLPDLAELIQLAERPDPDALAEARIGVRAALAHALYDELESHARANVDPTALDAVAAGRRALKSAAVDLLAAAPERSGALLLQVFHDAKTMTERMAALDALGVSGLAAFDEALAAFHARYRDNPLVIDKWFAAQAAAPRLDALARTKGLLRHPDYDPRNPNRVRALILGFALRNPRAFHAADGSGYRFLIEVVREADRLNPALAARMLAPFESWRRFDAARQGHAGQALRGLLAVETLSKNVREIAERTLSPC